MVVSVIGVQAVDFQGKEGNTIKGSNVFYTYARNGVSGLAADRAFLSESRFPVIPSPGDSIDLSYNRYGKIESFDIL